MKAITVLCLVFFLALSQAVVSNHFAQKRAEVSQSGLTSPLVFTIDSTEVAIGSVSCTNSSTGRNAIRITIDVDNSVVLTKFAVYFNTPGATRYITQEQYGYVENNATNGYSYSQCGLHTNRYRYTVNYTSLVEVIGSECFEVDVALSFKKFNGSYAPLSAVSQSLPGCDIEYQVYSPAPNSYLQIVFGANQTVDGYCLNAGLTIAANTPYQAQILSSYDPAVLGSAPGEYVGNPQNFDLVNYIFNNIERYTSRRFANVTGERCGWQDIQYAIWSLLDNQAPTQNLTVPISASCISTIIADARANGEGYVPSCPGGSYVVFLVPIDRDCQLNCTRMNGTQITGFVQGGPCLSECELRYNYYNSSASGNFCIGAECAAPVFASVSASVSSSSSASASSSASVVVAASPSSSAVLSNSGSASASSSASSSASASASVSPIDFPQIPTRSSSPSQGPQDK